MTTIAKDQPSKYTFPVVCGGCFRLIQVENDSADKALTEVQRLIELERGECNHYD